MTYYLIEKDEKTGPFTIEQLNEKDLYKETLVWTKGLDEWTEAKNIPMLKDIIDQTPPLYNIAPKQQVTPPEPPIYKKPVEDYFGYKLATKWERFIATFIETLIMMIPLLIITKGDYLNDDSYISVYDIAINILGAIMVGGLMYPIWSGNIGHKIFGIKVISKETGEDIKNPIKGIIREFSKVILSYFIIPMIWLFWDKDRQNLYDKISKTIVVKKKEA
ncbi:MAG: RDD family protein [Flavobacteriaceae bacterium]|nr:RDD family protein [Flavobacteriaceae bacterium]